MAVLRELIQTSIQIITQAFDAKEDVQTLVDDAERRIFGLAERRLEGSALPVGKILKNTFEYIERLYERKEHVTGVATGFEKLDVMTSGFQPSDFVIIAGRPSTGKTAFALNIAQSVGITLQGKELSVPVVALSQLSRAVETREQRRPQLSDLRESGALEQDSDLILFLYRPSMYRDDLPPDKANITEIIIGKQRNGPTGSVEAVF